jgi:hypothetical protein
VGVAVVVEVGQQRPERSPARAAGMPVQDAPNGGEVEELGLLSTLDGAPQVMRRHDGGQVEQRPGDGGRRDAALDRPLVGREA